MKEYTAPCAYCGQVRVVEIPEGMTPEDDEYLAIKEASRQCNCMAGEGPRQKASVLETADDHIEQILRAEHPEAADIFQQMKEFVYEGRIRKLTIREGNGGKAEMKRTKGGISVSYEKTNKTELQT